MAPAVVVSQTNSTASRIADNDQWKSLTRTDTRPLRFSLQPAASQSQDQSPLSDANAQVSKTQLAEAQLAEAQLAEAQLAEAQLAEDREDHFFLHESFELVDDALLSLLAQRGFPQLHRHMSSN